MNKETLDEETDDQNHFTSEVYTKCLAETIKEEIVEQNITHVAKHLDVSFKNGEVFDDISYECLPHSEIVNKEEILTESSVTLFPGYQDDTSQVEVDHNMPKYCNKETDIDDVIVNKAEGFEDTKVAALLLESPLLATSYIQASEDFETSKDSIVEDNADKEKMENYIDNTAGNDYDDRNSEEESDHSDDLQLSSQSLGSSPKPQLETVILVSPSSQHVEKEEFVDGETSSPESVDESETEDVQSDSATEDEAHRQLYQADESEDDDIEGHTKLAIDNNFKLECEHLEKASVLVDQTEAEEHIQKQDLLTVRDINKDENVKEDSEELEENENEKKDDTDEDEDEEDDDNDDNDDNDGEDQDDDDDIDDEDDDNNDEESKDYDNKENDKDQLDDKRQSDDDHKDTNDNETYLHKQESSRDDKNHNEDLKDNADNVFEKKEMISSGELNDNEGDEFEEFETSKDSERSGDYEYDDDAEEENFKERLDKLRTQETATSINNDIKLALEERAPDNLNDTAIGDGGQELAEKEPENKSEVSSDVEDVSDEESVETDEEEAVIEKQSDNSMRLPCPPSLTPLQINDIFLLSESMFLGEIPSDLHSEKEDSSAQDIVERRSGEVVIHKVEPIHAASTEAATSPTDDTVSRIQDEKSRLAHPEDIFLPHWMKSSVKPKGVEQTSRKNVLNESTPKTSSPEEQCKETEGPIQTEDTEINAKQNEDTLPESKKEPTPDRHDLDGDTRKCLEWLSTLSDCAEMEVISTVDSTDVITRPLSPEAQEDELIKPILQQNDTQPEFGIVSQKSLEKFNKSFASDDEIDFASKNHQDALSEPSHSPLKPKIQFSFSESARSEKCEEKPSDSLHDMLEVFGITDQDMSRLTKRNSTSSVDSHESADPNVVKMLEAFGMVEHPTCADEIETELLTTTDMNLVNRPESPSSTRTDENENEGNRQEESEHGSACRVTSVSLQTFEDSFHPVHEIDIGEHGVNEVRRCNSPEAEYMTVPTPNEPGTAAAKSDSIDISSRFDFTIKETMLTDIESGCSAGTNFQRDDSKAQLQDDQNIQDEISLDFSEEESKKVTNDAINEGREETDEEDLLSVNDVSEEDDNEGVDDDKPNEGDDEESADEKEESWEQGLDFQDNVDFDGSKQQIAHDEKKYQLNELKDEQEQHSYKVEELSYEEETESDEGLQQSDDEGQQSDKEGHQSDEEGQQSDEEGQQSDEEGQQSSEEGQQSDEEGQQSGEEDQQSDEEVQEYVEVIKQSHKDVQQFDEGPKQLEEDDIQQSKDIENQSNEVVQHFDNSVQREDAKQQLEQGVNSLSEALGKCNLENENTETNNLFDNVFLTEIAVEKTCTKSEEEQSGDEQSEDEPSENEPSEDERKEDCLIEDRKQTEYLSSKNKDKGLEGNEQIEYLSYKAEETELKGYDQENQELSKNDHYLEDNDQYIEMISTLEENDEKKEETDDDKSEHNNSDHGNNELSEQREMLYLMQNIKEYSDILQQTCREESSSDSEEYEHENIETFEYEDSEENAPTSLEPELQVLQHPSLLHNETERQKANEKHFLTETQHQLPGEENSEPKEIGKDAVQTSKKRVSFLHSAEEDELANRRKLVTLKNQDSEIFYTVDNSAFEDMYYDAKDASFTETQSEQVEQPDNFNYTREDQVSEYLNVERIEDNVQSAKETQSSMKSIDLSDGTDGSVLYTNESFMNNINKTESNDDSGNTHEKDSVMETNLIETSTDEMYQTIEELNQMTEKLVSMCGTSESISTSSPDVLVEHESKETNWTETLTDKLRTQDDTDNLKYNADLSVQEDLILTTVDNEDLNELMTVTKPPVNLQDQDKEFQDKDLKDKEFQDKDLKDKEFQDKDFQDKDFQDKDFQDKDTAHVTYTTESIGRLHDHVDDDNDLTENNSDRTSQLDEINELTDRLETLTVNGAETNQSTSTNSQVYTELSLTKYATDSQVYTDPSLTKYAISKDTVDIRDVSCIESASSKTTETTQEAQTTTSSLVEQESFRDSNDYTAQLAEVHSMMTSFSRRVSGDIDLCQLDVIEAIDSLVEKMAYELQQGTLSTSEVMQEISNLTTGRQRQPGSLSEPSSYQTSRESSPRKTEAVETSRAPSTPKDDGSHINRNQLEKEIYEILDEIMTLLGAVSPATEKSSDLEHSTDGSETSGSTSGGNIAQERCTLEKPVAAEDQETSKETAVPCNTPLNVSLIESEIGAEQLEDDLFIQEDHESLLKQSETESEVASDVFIDNEDLLNGEFHTLTIEILVSDNTSKDRREPEIDRTEQFLVLDAIKRAVLSETGQLEIVTLDQNYNIDLCNISEIDRVETFLTKEIDTVTNILPDELLLSSRLKDSSQSESEQNLDSHVAPVGVSSANDKQSSTVVGECLEENDFEETFRDETVACYTEDHTSEVCGNNFTLHDRWVDTKLHGVSTVPKKCVDSSTSDDDFEIIPDFEFSTNVSETLADQVSAIRSTMFESGLQESGKRVEVDAEQSVLFRLQTLYYVDKHGNRLLTEDSTTQHTSPVSREDVEVQEDDFVMIDGGVLAYQPMHIDDQILCESGNEKELEQDDLQADFDDRLADELAENIVNEVLDSQEHRSLVHSWQHVGAREIETINDISFNTVSMFETEDVSATKEEVTPTDDVTETKEVIIRTEDVSTTKEDIIRTEDVSTTKEDIIRTEDVSTTKEDIIRTED
uniref:Uncharacterized protein n=1 Tax=Biomphalaria glabrata TaxID=6526 RepID=A0A2C9JPL9_BIOGL